MRNLLFALFSLLGSAVAVAATSVNADPYGLELGAATSTQVKERFKGNQVSEAGISAVTGGPMLMFDSPNFGPEGLQSALFVFDKQDRLAAIQMTLPKEFAGKNVNAIADQLATKYAQKARNLPSVGNGTARYERGNSVVLVDAPNMSFEFTVSYMTLDFQRRMVENKQKERLQKDALAKSSL
jgi:hypothetical protein